MSIATEKWEHNWDVMRGSYSRYFIHVPVQFGNLSDEKRGVKHIDTKIVKRDGEIVAQYRLLKIEKHFTGAGRKLIFFKERQKEPQEDGEYHWDYGFERHTKDKWDNIEEIIDVVYDEEVIS